MLRLKRRGQTAPQTERFTTDEALEIFRSITPYDIKVMKALEQRAPAVDVFVASRAEIKISAARESLMNLGSLGLLTTVEGEVDALPKLDSAALAEVVRKVALAPSFTPT